MTFMLLGLVNYLTAFVLLFVITTTANQQQYYWGDQNNGQHYYCPYGDQSYYDYYDPWGRPCDSDCQNTYPNCYDNNCWDNNGRYIYPYPGDSQRGKPPELEGGHEDHDANQHRIPYWTNSFQECLMACKNEIVCIDYCSFRFGLNPSARGNSSTVLTEWIHSTPVYINGTWFFRGMKPLPPHWQKYPPPRWYIPGSSNRQVVDSNNNRNNYYNRQRNHYYNGYS